MHREDLIDQLTQDAFAYVMHGTFPERHFLDEITPAELDERFADYEMLVRLHFILRPEVVEFVETLPKHLRQVKTQTEQASKRRRGAVQGRINWPKTVRERYARNPHDRALFVCDDRTEDYDVPENIVLKRLLSVVYQTLIETRDYLRADYDWVTDRWHDNLELIDQMTDVFERNVHVRRIREPASYEPTERMFLSAEDSRSTLYRNAADLLKDYRATLEGDETAIADLLHSTLVAPDDDETLFELFVLFKYIGAVESLSEEEFTLQTIKSDKQEIARLHDEETNTRVVLYHDNSGDKRISFDASPEGEIEEFGRYEMVHHQSVETARQYFENETLRSSTGRPDVIVLEVADENSREYLITEVKYSKRQETIRQGIEETLEYLAFLKQDDDFVFGPETRFTGSGWNGLLVVQDIEDRETASFDEQANQPIRILQASEVEQRLTDVVETVL